MSNYKWVKIDGRIELRKEDFTPAFFEVKSNNINPLILKNLAENGIGNAMGNNGSKSYLLIPINAEVIQITAPLYECLHCSNEFVLISESYTDNTYDTSEYEKVRDSYINSSKEIANEQKQFFTHLFDEKSLDGISSVVTITLNPYHDPDCFYEEYVPKEYIQVCKSNCKFSTTQYDAVFIKKMDAHNQSITIKVPNCYKGLVKGKGGENIKKIATMINARRINVI